MKTYIYLLITVLSINTALAQGTIKPISQLGTFNEEPNTSYYYKDINNDFDKFLGTWVYTNGTVNFTINFSFLPQYESGTGNFYDKIYAKIKFVDNGEIVYNSIEESSYNHKDISGANLHSNDSNKISLTYTESSVNAYKVYAHLILEYVPCLLNNGCEQLIWNNTYLKETAEEPWPFVIPTNMTLTRQ